MDWINQITLNQLVTIVLILLGAGLVIALLLIGVLIARVKRIQLPPDADPISALLATPLLVVITLDLLDFSLDFLSAPFAWVLLGRLGLQPLRAVTVIESLIPGTQFIPTMTAAWILARLIPRDSALDRAVRGERLPGFRER